MKICAILNLQGCNRNVNNDKVDDLVNSLYSSYPIPFILHAVYDDKHFNHIVKILILDGQHRVEAIRKFIENDINGECSYNVWLWIYKINYAETSNTKLVLDIFRKINNNRIFSNDELPDTFIIDLVNKLCDVPLFKKNKAIGTNVSANACHSPCIHKKELNFLFNKHKEQIISSQKTIPEIIDNILIINHRISMKSYEQLYAAKNKNSELEKRRYHKAVSIKFFLNLKNSLYNPNIWIKFIFNPNDLSNYM